MGFDSNLKINKSNITDEFGKQPSLIYEFGRKVVELEFNLNAKKDQLKVLVSKKASAIRAKYARSKTKGLNESMVEDLINIDEEIITLRSEITNLKRLHALAELKQKSLETKGTSLENMGHNIREESKAGRNGRSKL